MRLNEKQVQAIKTALTVSYGSDAEVWLFGSRTDDTLRGGDIDLLVRNAPEGEDGFKRKIKFQVEMEKRLGERRIDVVVEKSGDERLIVQNACDNGSRL